MPARALTRTTTAVTGCRAAAAALTAQLTAAARPSALQTGLRKALKETVSLPSGTRPQDAALTHGKHSCPRPAGGGSTRRSHRPLDACLLQTSIIPSIRSSSSSRGKTGRTDSRGGGSRRGRTMWKAWCRRGIAPCVLTAGWTCSGCKAGGSGVGVGRACVLDTAVKALLS